MFFVYFYLSTFVVNKRNIIFRYENHRCKYFQPRVKCDVFQAEQFIINQLPN